MSDAGGPPAALRIQGNARAGPRCAECGFVETVRPIFRLDETFARCAVADGHEAYRPRNPSDVDDRDRVPPLLDLVAGAMTGDHGTPKIRLTRWHRFVVRLRDGSKRVFEEETPRTLRAGERIIVIAGATGFGSQP